MMITVNLRPGLKRKRAGSPFAGVLPPAEVWSIKAVIRQRHAKTAA